MSETTPTGPTPAQQDRLMIEVTIAAPVDVVWRALRDPVEIGRWFGWEYASLGEEITFIFEKDVTILEEGRALLLHGTNERFVLEPQGDVTVLRLIRAVPAGSDWKDIYDDIGEGWTSFVHQLRFVLERHRGAQRRSLYLAGHAETAETTLPIQALGLAELAGPRYETAVAGGEALAGQYWFRSPHQVGLTVDAYGDGLLVVTECPAGVKPKSPHGSGQAIITTYGLDDEAFGRLAKSWTDWWRAHYTRVTVQDANSPGDMPPA